MYVDEKSTVPAAWNDPTRNAMDQMLENMKNFRESALSGRFAVEETAGDELLRVIRALQDWLTGRAGEHGLLGRRPMLGGSYGARAMAPHVQQAAEDQQGFLTQLGRLREVLADAEDGVRRAMANYRHTEHGVAGTFQR